MGTLSRTPLGLLTVERVCWPDEEALPRGGFVGCLQPRMAVNAGQHKS